MRKIFYVFLYLTLLAASCAPQSASRVISEIPAPPTTLAHAAEIRFGLIGAPRDVNVWELFDETGANYADYALRSEYWARLYSLIPPKFSFQPLAAQGLPTDVIQDGDFYSSTVKLRPDLKWTDNTRFTAEDVAFTVNTALTLELGLDWNAYYSRDYLDHAEAIDALTVKFIFKQKPNVGIWQYGALQGVIVQKAFWESKISESIKLLPEDSLKAEIEKARTHLATAQWDVNDLAARLLAVHANGHGDRQLEIDLAQRQNELNHAQNDLAKLLDEYASKIKSAHQSLYALDDAHEPTLGAWIFQSNKNGVWINRANPDFPFGKPNFDYAVYSLFENEQDALAAFKNNKVDFILSPTDLPHDIQGARINPTYNARFLVFNPLNPQLADAALHAALSCMIDRRQLAENILQNQVAPLNAFILSTQWHDADVKDACAVMNRVDRIEYAVKLLKDAGYSWAEKPTTKNSGRKLTAPNGEPFPKIILIAPSKEADGLRYAAAKYIAEQAQYLGMQFSVQDVSLNDIVYAVYSSQEYDAALIGWRLSEYPQYVCDWFGGANPYLFNGNQFAVECDALKVEVNIEKAKQSLRQVESGLLSAPSFIPLFTLTRADIYQNLAYPSARILNGWGSLYGAPLYAIPSP